MDEQYTTEQERFDQLWRKCRDNIATAEEKQEMLRMQEGYTPPWDHKERHKLLHRHLDELFADFIKHHPDVVNCTQKPIMELLTWSAEQTQNPT